MQKSLSRETEVVQPLTDVLISGEGWVRDKSIMSAYDWCNACTAGIIRNRNVALLLR